jgi:hypothetical protein
MTTPLNMIPIHRLRSESLYLGLNPFGMSRNDLIMELRNQGLYEIDTRFPAKPPKIDTSNRKDDLSNTFVGNGSGLNETRSNRLYIANNDTQSPLIGGDFLKNKVEITHILNITNKYFESDEHGVEGDVRRNGNQLFMYRSTNVHPGWYPIVFGPVLVI